MAWTWLSVPCTKCGAQVDEECFETDRVWGKLPVPGVNRQHEERIMAIIRSPDNPGRPWLCGGVQRGETKSAPETRCGARGGSRLGNPCDE